MRRMVHMPGPHLPTVERVLWRAGTPPSKAGPLLGNAAGDAIALLSRTMRPEARSLSFGVLPEALRGAFAPALNGAGNVTVLVATLGREVDECLENLQSRGRMLEAHLFNSAASESVELLAAAARLEAGRLFPGMEPGARLAPGYGDVPLAVQARIVALFPGMGVKCSESFYLQPAKTITGVWEWVRRS